MNNFNYGRTSGKGAGRGRTRPAILLTKFQIMTKMVTNRFINASRSYILHLEYRLLTIALYLNK